MTLPLRPGSHTPPLEFDRSPRNDSWRRHLVRTVLGIAALFLVLALVGSVLGDSMFAATELIYSLVGVSGLLLIIAVCDAVITPIPPDAALVIIANSSLASSALWLVPVIGVVSAMAGNFGYWAAATISKRPSLAKFSASLRTRYAPLARQGKWAVAIGALTPVPFSATCWAAGLLGVPASQVFPMTLLRIPRFVLMYLTIAYASQLGVALP